MTKFNQFLILLTLLLFASCARLAFADDYCKLSVNTSERSLQELNKLSRFMQANEMYPGRMYQYNGVSVTAEQYEKLMLEKYDKNVDPGLRMP